MVAGTTGRQSTMAQGRGLKAFLRHPRLSKRAWRIVAIVGGVVLLAAVLLASSALSKPKSSRSPQAAAIARQIDSEVLTDQGLSALSSNETATAQSLLQRAVALNPGNARATAALVSIRQSTASNSGGGNSGGGSNGGSSNAGGSDSTPSTPRSSAFDKKLDIAKLLPVAVAGYTMYPREVLGADAQVSADPQTKGARVIWAVHDRGTASAAAKFISAVSKRAYPKNAQTVSIDGATAYIGTDGVRYATAAYVRGRYAFEVIVSLATPSTNMSPALQMAREASAAFPDTP